MTKPAYSIVGRLCRQLFWQTLVGMGLVCAGIYAATSMFIKAEQREELAGKVVFIQELIHAAAKKNGEPEIVAKLTHFAPRRPGTFLEVWRADGSQLYRDGNDNDGSGGAIHLVILRLLKTETTTSVLTGFPSA